mgnify:CR=1 FL=1
MLAVHVGLVPAGEGLPPLRHGMAVVHHALREDFAAVRSEARTDEFSPNLRTREAGRRRVHREQTSARVHPSQQRLLLRRRDLEVVGVDHDHVVERQPLRHERFHTLLIVDRDARSTELAVDLMQARFGLMMTAVTQEEHVQAIFLRRRGGALPSPQVNYL